MFAVFPMYDFPELRPFTVALWDGVRRHLPDQIRDTLLNPTGRNCAEQWQDPHLLMGQTCGYPLAKHLKGSVRVVATPEYALQGCQGPYHCSFLISNHMNTFKDLSDFRNCRAAINSLDSNSGMNLFRASIAPLGKGQAFFSSVVCTGSHVASLAAVASGEVDIAAIDCVTFGLLKRLRPDATSGVKVIGTTPMTPALPFITSRSLGRKYLAHLRAALTAAMEDPSLTDVRKALGLSGISFLPRSAYRQILEFERQAQRLGYPYLA